MDQLVRTGFDQTVRLWDTATGAELHALRGHTELCVSSVGGSEALATARLCHGHLESMTDPATDNASQIFMPSAPQYRRAPFGLNVTLFTARRFARSVRASSPAKGNDPYI